MSRDESLERLVTSHQEPAEVRSLLEVGIADEVGDYDFERGLATHLAAIAPSPLGPGGASSAPGAGSAASPAGLAAPAKSLALWIGAPLASLTAIAAVVLLRAHGPSSEVASAHGSSIAAVEVASRAGAETAVGDPAVNGSLEPQRAAGMVAPGSVVLGANVSSGSHSVRDESSVSKKASHAVQSAGSESASRRLAVRPEAVVLDEAVSSRRERSTSGTASESAGIVRALPDSKSTPGPVVAGSARPAPTVDVGRSDAEIARDKAARDEARRAADDKLQREMDELMRAKRALSSDPRLALELARHGEREFPDSMLSEERRHVLLLALIGVGRVSDAERLAAPYLAQHPDSPFARRVRAALEAASKHRESR